MRIVFLDAKTVGNISLDSFDCLGDFTTYELTSKADVAGRIENADIVLTNKVAIGKDELNYAKNLKLICVTATGTNNIDLKECQKRGIEVRNCVGYSTASVAQITFSSILAFMSQILHFDNYVKSAMYANSAMFTDMSREFSEISGKKFCVVGLGNIGKEIYKIAKAFGCDTYYYSTSGQNDTKDFRRVGFDEMIESDIISIHCGLNEKTKDLFDSQAVSKMKKSAILCNFGRGGIVCEKSVADALDGGLIAGYVSDVFEKEPMCMKSPLLKIKDYSKILFTPHIAWASYESRVRLMKQVEENIKSWSKNSPN